MTELGAIKRINTLYKLYVEDEPESEHYLYAEARCMAIQSLEKQIPKKPIIQTNLMTKHVSAHCSICNTDITYYSSGENYCHNCGQALKWD